MVATETTEQAVARTLAEAEDLSDAYPRVLRIIGERLGWAWAAIWEPEPDGQPPLHSAAAWWATPDLESFDGATCAISLRAGQGLPGRVWAANAAAWIVDVTDDANFPRIEAARAAGLHAALCFPVRTARGVVAVVELLSTETHEPDAELLRTLETLGDQIGQAVSRRRAEEAAHIGDQRTRAMLEAALDAVIAIDHTGAIVAFNPAAEKTFGYVAEDVMGKEMAALIVPPSLRERHRVGIARYLVTGKGPRARPARGDHRHAVGRQRVPGRADDHPHRRARPADVHRLPARHHRAQAGRGRAARLAHPHGRGGRRGAPAHRARPARRRAAAACRRSRWTCGSRAHASTPTRRVGQVARRSDRGAAGATAELRELARGIHPGGPDRGRARPGAADAGHPQRVPTTLETSPSTGFPSASRSTAYFVAAEGLTNVARYAEATRA